MILTSYRYNAESSCTSGFMDMDVIKKTVYYKTLFETGPLDMELRVVPNWNFTCDANITRLLLGVRIHPDGELQYPEVQTWERYENWFSVVNRRSLNLSPGIFSTDGVIQYHLIPPMPVAAGEMLGVHQPKTHTESTSVVRLYYIMNDEDAPVAYKLNGQSSNSNSFEDRDAEIVENEYILLSAITGSEIK